MEVEHLNQADTHVVNGERRVSEQRMRLEQLRADGYQTGEAEHLLVNLEQTLAQMQAHREVILRTIAQIDAGLA